jgi:TorA maturation chaperone TorD
MELLDRGARAGTAGFVLSRLLLAPPSQALAGNFGTPQMRETWPLRDPESVAALGRLAPDPYETLPRDHTTLFGRRHPLVAPHESAWVTGVDRADLLAELAAAYEGANFTALPTPVDDHVGYQVAYLADLATVVGRAGAGGDEETSRSAAATATQFRAAHLDRVVEPILQGIAAHARTHLYRAVPGLLRGFLAEHERLCTATLDHQPA